MIGQYESNPKDYFLYAPRQYGLSQQHKHLPEVQHVCGLSEAPIFIPTVTSMPDNNRQSMNKIVLH